MRRTDWREFPDIVIHPDDSVVKKHLFYATANAGDVTAERLFFSE
jgi:hypothetical protein